MSVPAKNGANLRLLASVLNPARELSVSSIARQTTPLITGHLPRRPSNKQRKLRQPFSTSRAQGILQQRPFSTSRPCGHVEGAQQSSVNADEVSHFSRLASEWWDPQGSSRLLHLMNPLRHDFIAECLATDPNPAHSKLEGESPGAKKYTYLDIGCGGGIFAESAARMGNALNVTAIDPTPEVLSIAKEHSRHDPSLASKLTYINTPIEDLSFHLNENSSSEIPQFDIVTIFEVIEHVPSPASFLRLCTRHLKPGGWLIMSTIARTPMSFLTTKLIAEMPVVGIVPPGTHTWSQYINPEELEDYFEKEGGWDKTITRGVAYVPAFGWKWVPGGWGGEGIGNYFFGVKKME